MLGSAVGSLEVGSLEADAGADAGADADTDAPGPFSAVGVEEEGAVADPAVSDATAEDDSPALAAGIGADADGGLGEAIATRFNQG